MSSLSRRRFAVSVSAAIALGTNHAALVGEEKEGSTESTLRHWVETLFPADLNSPGAGEIGVHLEILKKADGIPEYARLILSGTGWADAMAVAKGGIDFARLDDTAKIEIVSEAESLGPESGPGYFFVHTLQDTTTFYYSHRESWSGLGFSHSPQPIGFPDFADAPS